MNLHICLQAHTPMRSWCAKFVPGRVAKLRTCNLRTRRDGTQGSREVSMRKHLGHDGTLLRWQRGNRTPHGHTAECGIAHPAMIASPGFVSTDAKGTLVLTVRTFTSMEAQYEPFVNVRAVGSPSIFLMKTRLTCTHARPCGGGEVHECLHADLAQGPW